MPVVHTDSVSDPVSACQRDRPVVASAGGPSSHSGGRPAVYQDIIRSLQGLTEEQPAAEQQPPPATRTVRLR